MDSEIGNDTDPDSNGTTTVTFNFSDQLSQNVGISWMVGGCVPMVAGGGARDVAIKPGLNTRIVPSIIMALPLPPSLSVRLFKKNLLIRIHPEILLLIKETFSRIAFQVPVISYR